MWPAARIVSWETATSKAVQGELRRWGYPATVGSRRPNGDSHGFIFVKKAHPHSFTVGLRVALKIFGRFANGSPFTPLAVTDTQRRFRLSQLCRQPPYVRRWQVKPAVANPVPSCQLDQRGKFTRDFDTCGPQALLRPTHVPARLAPEVSRHLGLATVLAGTGRQTDSLPRGRLRPAPESWLLTGEAPIGHSDSSRRRTVS